MNDKQRDAQITHQDMSGIHNTCPGQCMLCGKLVVVGMKQDCPHEQTGQKQVIYPLGTE